MRTASRTTASRRSSRRSSIKSPHDVGSARLAVGSTRPQYHVPQSETTHMQYVMAIVLVYLALVSFLVYKSYSEETSEETSIISSKRSPKKKSALKKKGVHKENLVTNMQKHAAEGVSVSRPKIQVAKSEDGVFLDQLGDKSAPDYQSKTFKAIRDSVDGMGNVIPVEVDGAKIDRVVVQTAIEDNKDFYPRVDQSHVYQSGVQEFDSTQVPQDGMFSPIPPTPFGFG